jgi:5-methylcytosine-specific restriction endonuclease McrA
MAYNGEKKREYQRQWVAKRRQQWIDEHGPCVVCGSADRLEVDHIDPDKKTIDATNLWSLSLRNPIRIKELENCQVLCYVCHKAKTKKQFENTEHGTTTMYRKGCHCELCKAAATIDRRKYARNTVK